MAINKLVKQQEFEVCHFLNPLSRDKFEELLVFLGFEASDSFKEEYLQNKNFIVKEDNEGKIILLDRANNDKVIKENSYLVKIFNRIIIFSKEDFDKTFGFKNVHFYKSKKFIEAIQISKDISINEVVRFLTNGDQLSFKVNIKEEENDIMKNDNFIITKHKKSGTFPWYEINLLNEIGKETLVIDDEYIIKDDKGNFKVMSDKDFEKEYEMVY